MAIIANVMKNLTAQWQRIRGWIRILHGHGWVVEVVSSEVVFCVLLGTTSRTIIPGGIDRDG